MFIVFLDVIFNSLFWGTLSALDKGMFIKVKKSLGS